MANSNSQVIAGYIESSRADRHYLMNENERRFINDLLEQVIIYRGCSKKEIKSNKLRCSWTLEREVAEFSAYKYTTDIDEKIKVKDRLIYDVIERVINKDEIVAYFGDRDESEILYFPNN
jgi:hypothetical protein